uniref:BHLH domain-containing protein n=1 Tax=Steinernema glaseri TaxID=37863 RepID=A0A1I7ZIK8_9BILA
MSSHVEMNPVSDTNPIGNLLLAAELLNALPHSSIQVINENYKNESSSSGKIRCLVTASTSQPVIPMDHTVPMLQPRSSRPSSNSSSSTRHSRAAHNELEKTRRANLRGSLEQLKQILPSDTDCSRDTTLALLTRARNHLLSQERRKAELLAKRQALAAERLRIAQELDQVRNECKAREEAQSIAFNTTSVTPSIDENRLSPMYLEYSPSAKPSVSPALPVVPFTFDPVLDGLVPAWPLLYPYSHHQPAQNLLCQPCSK